MIYDIFNNFNASDIKYDKDNVNPGLPVESLSKFYNNKIKIESTKIKDIETALADYSTLMDDVLGMEVHNEDQYNRLKESRMRMGLTDDIYPDDLKDLSNTAKLTQFKSKIKRYVNSPEIKMIIDEQKKANEYRSKVNEIMSMNEPLGILALKEYVEKYGSKSEKSYGGFDLNINDYIPMDVDDEIGKIAKDIEREYRLEKDPNSPTGDGYIFINKISGVTENGKEIMDRRVNSLRANKRFNNNVNSLIALNSKDTDYLDEETYDTFLSEMIETHLGDKVVSVETKKIDTAKTNASGKPAKDISKTPIRDAFGTEAERWGYDTRKMLETDYPGYDYTSLNTAGKALAGFMPISYVPNPELNTMDVTFRNFNSDKTEVLSYPKIESGKKVATLAEEEKLRHEELVAEQGVAATSTATSTQESQQKTEDVTISNPDRQKAVQEAGVSNQTRGASVANQDGTNKWVYKHPSNNKVVVIDDAVNLSEEGGFKLKDVGMTVSDFHLERDTAMKAKDFVSAIDALDIDYWITEAGTDTVDRGKGHASPKHYDGTTFDMSFRKQEDKKDVNKILETMVKAYEQDLHAQYEVNDQALVNELNKKIEAYNKENGTDLKKALKLNYPAHFSVYNYNKGAGSVKKPPVSENINAYESAHVKKNSEYVEHVRNNDYKNLTPEGRYDKDFEYLKSKNPMVYSALKDERGHVYGKDQQTIVSLIARSKSMADWLNKSEDNAKTAKALSIFIQNPQLQEDYMDELLTNIYEPLVEEHANTKYNADEIVYLRHLIGNADGIRDEIYSTGEELLKEHGFLDGDKFNPKRESDYNRVIQSFKGNQAKKTLFRLAYEKRKDRKFEDYKDMMSFLESESSGGYAAVSAISTAVGKYQIMWSYYSGDIQKLIENGGYVNVETDAPPASEQPQAEIPQDVSVSQDSLSLNRFKSNN